MVVVRDNCGEGEAGEKRCFKIMLKFLSSFFFLAPGQD